MRCDELVSVLPGLVDGSASLDLGGRRHVEACLRCQAELAQYRKLVRGLRSLQGQLAPVPGLVGDILAALEAGEVPHRGAFPGRRAAYLSGLAAATAAGAAGAIVLATRARSRRLAG